MAATGRDVRSQFLVAALLLLAAIPLAATGPSRAGDSPPILRVGMLDEPKAWNPLSPLADEPATADVLARVYERPVKLSPNAYLAVVDLAYLAKGVDADEDGTFEASEYGAFDESGTATPPQVTVYYDFNGFRWHDGTPMDAWDLLFSYHAGAMTPFLRVDLYPLFPAATYEAGGRQLNVSLVDVDPATPGYQKRWEGEAGMPGDPDLRVAVEFRLREPFARFAPRTLATPLLPIHVWSGTGGGRHADFGCAIYVPPAVAADRGMPCGTPDAAKWGRGVHTNATDAPPFAPARAQAWTPAAADVIGSGPFVLRSWSAGVGGLLERFDGYYVGETYDPRLLARLHRPYIGGVAFSVYATPQLALSALQSDEIDFFLGTFGPEFVPDLLKDPGIAIEANAEPGFALMVYNLRKAPWGYENDNPARDVGHWLRQAASHLVDLRGPWDCWYYPSACRMFGFVHPANTFWYNDNIPKPGFDLTQVAAILDSPEARAAGIGPDPPGACRKATPDGCRTLLGIGNASFDVLAPLANIDPQLASAGAMIADAMRQVGLNAVSLPTPPADLLARRNARTFDAYLAYWDIREVDPDYLFGAFHGSNRDAGPNHAGLANATVDGLLEDSRRALDRTVRQERAFRVQEALAAVRPAEPLFYRGTLDAYRQDRFVNWTVDLGTVWNEWSLFGIRVPKPREAPRVVLSAPSALRAGDAATVTATVTDSQGTPLPGATVSLVASAGNLTVGAEKGPAVNGTTDAAGRISARFDAPAATVEMDVLISALASHPNFEDRGRGGTLIRIFPTDVPFLSITLQLPVGDIARPGDALPMRIAVVDPFRVPVPDARVTVESADPAAVRAEPDSGTAAELASVLLRVDPNVANGTAVRITVRASKAPYADGEQDVTIAILPREATYRCPTGELVADPADCPEVAGPPAFPISLVVGLGVAIGLAVAAAVFVLLRRRSAPPKP